MAFEGFDGFNPAVFRFLRELDSNNNRPWFLENKGRYEREVFEPCMAFIRAFRPRLKKISPYFVASDRRVGGSLMRVYRDARFSHGQDPYKTNVGVQFRHEFGRDIHAPGFYVHVAPDGCFLAMGVWRPDAASLLLIRQEIVERPDRWRRATHDPKFRQYCTLDGGSLKRPPRGFAADHPWIEDLKRTDFIGLCEVTERQVVGRRFSDLVATCFAASRPFMRFLCQALKVPF